MKLISTKLDNVVILEPEVHIDNRGFFMESYNLDKFNELGLQYHFIQDNHSLSIEPGVIRGLHYQLAPRAQAKLIRVLKGAIYDVVVDIRKNSPTYGQWISVVLSEDNKRQLLVPKGFAHGFCTLVSNTQILYKVDEYYAPDFDRGVIWNDPQIGIDWPISDPILSHKDKNLTSLELAENNFVYGG